MALGLNGTSTTSTEEIPQSSAARSTGCSSSQQPPVLIDLRRARGVRFRGAEPAHDVDHGIGVHWLLQNLPDAIGQLGRIIGVGRDHHDGDRRYRDVRGGNSEELEPIHSRHHQVEQDDARTESREPLKCFLAVSRLHGRESHRLQELRIGLPDVVVVLDQED